MMMRGWLVVALLLRLNFFWLNLRRGVTWHANASVVTVGVGGQFDHHRVCLLGGGSLLLEVGQKPSYQHDGHHKDKKRHGN